MRLFYLSLDEKHKLLAKFEKILEIFDENSIEKLNFYLFLGKVVAKDRAFGSNIIFLQQFFPVRGGGLNPLSPLRTPLACRIFRLRVSAKCLGVSF